MAATDTKEGKLTQEQERVIAQAKKPVSIANAVRMLFLLIAVVIMVVICIGDKVWAEKAWYAEQAAVLYKALIWDLLLMLAATGVKFGLAVRYNKIVRKV